MPAPRKRTASARTPRNKFGEALIEAQQQLTEAKSHLDYHLAEYHRLRAQIPSLQQIVNALQGSQQAPQPNGPHIAYYPAPYQPPAMEPPVPQNYSLETVMSDAPLGQDPSMTFVMPPVPPAVPPARPPMPSMTEMPRPPLPPRGGGGAIGMNIEPENENALLDEAEADPNSPASGKWR